MTQNDDSFFAKAYNPFLQGGICLAASVLFMLVAKGIQLTGMMEVSGRFFWMTATVFMLCFAVFNSVFLLSAGNIMRYWGRSLYSFLGLSLISGLLAWLISTLSIGEAGSYRWLYLVIFVVYLVFMAIMVTMRNIVDFAQREEWNHPRIRKNRRKNRNRGR